MVSGELPAVLIRHAPRGESWISEIASERDARAVPKSRNRAVSCAAVPSGPLNWGNSPSKAALKASPSVSTNPVSFQRASGSCSSTLTSSRSGHCRRSATLFTQGTFCRDTRASSSRIVKNVPRSSSRMTALMCAGLVRTSDPSTTTRRIANTGCRTAQAIPPQSSIATAATTRASAIALSLRGSSHMGALQYLQAKVGKRHSRLLRRHRHQAVTCHAGRGVHLEELPPSVGLQDEIEPTPATASDQLERVDRLRLDRLLGRCGQAARAVVARLVGEILVVVIVVALRRLDADQWQCTVVENRGGELDPGDELFDDHQRVVLRRQVVGERELVMVDRADFSDADGRAFVRRLDDERQAQLGHDRPPIRLRINDAIARCGNPGGNPDQLGAPLVHRQRGSHDTATGIRDAKHLECALHRSVFTKAAVQRDEYPVEALALELEDGALSRIERVCVNPALAQRFQDRVAREQRDLAFRRRAAHQHRHFSELTHSLSAFRSHGFRRWAAASPSRTGRFAAPRRARPMSTATFPNSLMWRLAF